MEQEACGYGMKREVQGAAAWSKGSFQRLTLGIPKQIALVREEF